MVTLLPDWDSVFGDPSAQDKPVLQQSIKKRERAYDALDAAMKDQTPVYNWAGGLAKVGTTLLDAYAAQKADSDANKAWASMFKSDDPTKSPVFGGLSQDQITMLEALGPETGLPIAAQAAFKAPADRWDEVRDANGNIVGQKNKLTGEVKAYPQAPKPDYTTVTPGSYILDSNGKVVFSAPNRPDKPSDFEIKYSMFKRTGLSDIDALKMAAGGGAGGARYYAVPTSSGYLKMDKFTGETSPITAADAGNVDATPPGTATPIAPAMPVGADVGLAGRRAEASAAGEVRGKTQATAETEMPAAKQSMDYVLGLINDVKTNPQLPNAVGLIGSHLPRIPGYNSDIISRIDQLQGNNFLQAYQGLKGGGQITEIEGQKAQEAQARLNRAQTVEEYQRALDDMAELVRQRYGVQQQKASGSSLKTKYGLE